MTRLRECDSPNALLRALLLHAGCCCSLRERAARARAAGLAGISDATLLSRLRQVEGCLQRVSQVSPEEAGVQWRGRSEIRGGTSNSLCISRYKQSPQQLALQQVLA